MTLSFYEAIFEFDKLALAKEKDRLRNLHIQKCSLIPKDIKGKLQIKSDRIQKLFTMYLKDTALTSEDRELIIQACSVYNCEIYSLLKTVRKWFLLRRIYWNFIKDSKVIFDALGDGSVWGIFMIEHHEIVVRGFIAIMVVLTFFSLGCTVIAPVFWIIFGIFTVITVVVGSISNKYIKESDLYGMVERVNINNSYLGRRRRDEVKGLSSMGIDTFKKIVDLGKFT